MPFLFVPVGEASLLQNKFLAICPKVSALLSFFASCYIILDVVRMYRRNPHTVRTYHRILLGLSICDTISSFAWFFTTWPIPPDVFPAYGASGTQATCTAQGFFTQFSISSVFYNGSLSLYYCLVVKFGWSDRRISDAHIERWMHLSALIYGLGTSVTSVFMGLFNPIGWDCWLSAVPLGCKESWLHHGETTCTRGDNANLYQWAFFYLPLWIIIFMVSIAMYMVYSAYRAQARRAEKWSYIETETEARKAMERAASGSASSIDPIPVVEELETQKSYLRPSVGGLLKKTGSSNRRSRNSTSLDKRRELVTTQAMLYVGAFFIVWFFPTILRIHEVTSDVVYYHWVILSAIFVPIQGLLNVYVYLRPKYLKKRRKRDSVNKSRRNTGVHATSHTGSTGHPHNINLFANDVHNSIEGMGNSNGSIHGSIGSINSTDLVGGRIEDASSRNDERRDGSRKDNVNRVAYIADSEREKDTPKETPMKCTMDFQLAEVVPDPMESDDNFSCDDKIDLTENDDTMRVETRPLTVQPAVKVSDLLHSHTMGSMTDNDGELSHS